ERWSGASHRVPGLQRPDAAHQAQGERHTPHNPKRNGSHGHTSTLTAREIPRALNKCSVERGAGGLRTDVGTRLPGCAPGDRKEGKQAMGQAVCARAYVRDWALGGTAGFVRLDNEGSWARAATWRGAL